jgi:hypothetical protein
MHEVMEAPEGHGGHAASPLTIPVAVTMSILAVMVAISTLLGHRASAERGILQTKAADQWSYYQAKNNRLVLRKSMADMLATLAPADKAKAQALEETYRKEVERYESDKDDISEKAKEFEKEMEFAGHQEDRFNAGEVILEMGLIVCSLTLLTNKRIFWLFGISLGVVGLLVTLSGFMLH